MNPHRFSLLALISLVGLTLGIAALDRAWGQNVSADFAYAFPVALGAALAGLPLGIGLSLLASALLVYVGVDVGHPFPKDGYLYLSTFGSLAVYLLIAGLTWTLRSSLASNSRNAKPEQSTPTARELSRAVGEACDALREEWVRFDHTLRLGEHEPLERKLDLFVHAARSHVARDCPLLVPGSSAMFFLATFAAVMASGTHPRAELSEAVRRVQMRYLKEDERR